MAGDKTKAQGLVDNLQRIQAILEERFNRDGLELRFDGITKYTAGGTAVGVTDYAPNEKVLNTLREYLSRLEAHVTAMQDSA